MQEVSIRPVQVSDADDFLIILNDPKLIDTGSRPKSLDDEKKRLQKSIQDSLENKQHNFSILYNGEIVGCLGVKMNIHRKYVGEIGCFLASDYRNKGIATEAIALGEKICFENLSITRLEAISPTDNIGSQKIALKSGFIEEGILRQAVRSNNGCYKDVYIYSKLINEFQKQNNEYK